MFVVIFLSQTFDGALYGDSFAFTFAILLLRAILAGLFIRTREAEPEADMFLEYWTESEVLTTLIVGVSLFVPEPARFGIWAAAFVINMGGVLFLYTVFEPVVLQMSPFPERLGLMTIVVLGETILAIAVGTSLSLVDTSVETLVFVAVGFSIPVAVWWIYFTYYDENTTNYWLSESTHHWRTARQRGLVHSFSHYLIHIGIVAAGVGIAVAVEALIAGHPVEQPGRPALGGGLALFLVGAAVCHRLLPDGIEDRIVGGRLVAAVLVASLAVAGETLSAVVLIGLTAGVLVGLVALEVLLPSPRAAGQGVDA